MGPIRVAPYLCERFVVTRTPKSTSTPSIRGADMGRRQRSVHQQGVARSHLTYDVGRQKRDLRRLDSVA